MREHPALAHKYLLPEFTRGRGIELGEGIDMGTTPLFPHFLKAEDLPAELPAGSLDFVLLCNAPERMAEATVLTRDGGFICSIAPAS